jgi:hypothetical protein
VSKLGPLGRHSYAGENRVLFKQKVALLYVSISRGSVSSMVFDRDLSTRFKLVDLESEIRDC